MLALLAALLPPAPAPAASGEASYALSVRGIEAARISLAGREEAGRYALAARVRSSGLVSLIADLRHDATVEGTLRGRSFRPEAYRETDEDDTVEVRWGGTVTSMRTPPRDRPEDVDPADQGGAVDPLTAVWAMLRPQPADEACNRELAVYDGSRRGTLRLGRPRPEGAGLRCAGSFSRDDGYSERQLREGREFAFTLTLAPAGDGLVQGREIRMQTTYGPAALRLR
jgi:hypothetical protein